MGATPEKLLALARQELGQRSDPPGSNHNKYNTAYYRREVQGPQYDWCAVFLWWLFRQAGAPELYYGGGRTAYCPTLMSYHRGQRVAGDYWPGDVIFFNFSGKSNPVHVGLCESWDGSHVTTIDGNTWEGNDARGGAVMRRRRSGKYIVGAYRPAYEEDEELTQEQIREIVREELKRLEEEREKLPASDWAAEGLREAVDRGITDGSRPQSWATRQEVALMVRAGQK